VAPDAFKQNKAGTHTGKLDRTGLDAELGKVAHEPDGRIRGMASRWIEGKSLGGTPAHGVRADDPNDRIPHEMRRDLRGMYSLYAWMDVVDVWPGNTLDVWATDPTDPQRHYVKHYSLDFGLSMGAMGMKYFDLRRGYEYRLEWPHAFAALFSFGVWRPAWEDRPMVNIRGVGSLFSAQGYDPGSWRPGLPYLPFETMDRFDAFWGAKLVGRFSRAQIRAAVEAGRFSDPRAVDYLTDTLVARQRMTVAYWYQRVNPLDNFRIGDGTVCFDDLALRQGIATDPRATRYVITPRDPDGHIVGVTISIGAAQGGRTCAPLSTLSYAAEAYTILQVTTLRPGFQQMLHVHIARNAAGATHVIGVWRA
jgi:hypothetical protein